MCECACLRSLWWAVVAGGSECVSVRVCECACVRGRCRAVLARGSDVWFGRVRFSSSGLFPFSSPSFSRSFARASSASLSSLSRSSPPSCSGYVPRSRSPRSSSAVPVSTMGCLSGVLVCVRACVRAGGFTYLYRHSYRRCARRPDALPKF